jgi:hypothetical protein
MGGSGNFRFRVGSCSKVPVSRGFKGHGIAPPQGIFFTDAELQAVRESEKKEMSHLVQGMNRSRPETTVIQVPFSWKPPDLREGGVSLNNRMSNLKKASGSFEDPASVIDEGIEAINVHRQNCTKDGPEAKRLQLLWWEFPKEHWQPLRDGGPMNFLQEPEPMIHDDAAMDPEETRVAAEFAEELLDLGVVQTPTCPDDCTSFCGTQGGTRRTMASHSGHAERRPERMHSWGSSLPTTDLSHP